jgi:predicted Zn-dependent protease
VNATQFVELIQKADRLEKGDYLLLKKVQKNFPYFHVAHALSSRFEAMQQDTNPSPSLPLAAVTSSDRKWLKKWLTHPIGASETMSAQKGNTATEAVASPKPKKRSAPKEDLIESIKRKDKKEILDVKKQEQIDLIKAFSKKDIKLATIKEIEANQNTENLADASTTLNDQVLSETFAKILLKQSKKAMAIEIYEKLALKFPEKRAYFADLIEKTKE